MFRGRVSVCLHTGQKRYNETRMDLVHKKCVPCEGGMAPLGPADIKKYAHDLKTPWHIRDQNKLSQTFTYKDFKAAMEFVNQVAKLAESEGHHPDMHILYNRVTIELTTHAVGGLSENDFIIAAKIERIPHS